MSSPTPTAAATAAVRTETGAVACRYAIVINGGACAAILAFLAVGMLMRGAPDALFQGLANALSFFGFGVLLGALAFGASFVSTYAAGLSDDERAISVLSNHLGGIQGLAVGCVVGTYLMFFLGILLTRRCFELAPYLG